MAVHIGFVGVGSIANIHITPLMAMKDKAKITAVCDVNAERAGAAAKKTGAKPYAKWQEMLDAEVLDALYICTPPFAHGDLEIAAAKRKLPLLIEKPIGINPKDVRKMASAIRSAGIITSVAYHWRYTEAAKMALDFIKSSGAKITCALGFWTGGMPEVEWWRRRDGSGGQINEQTTHIFDLMRYIIGKEPQKVHAVAAKGLLAGRVKNFDIEDSSCVIAQFGDDTVGTLVSSCALAADYKIGLHILTDKGNILIELVGNCTIQTPSDTKTITDPWGMPAYAAENKAFINAVQTGDTSGIRSTYDDAVKTFAFTSAAIESIRTGKPASPEKI